MHFLQMPGGCTSGKLLALLLDWVLDSQLVPTAEGDSKTSPFLMDGPSSPPSLQERCAKVCLVDYSIPLHAEDETVSIYLA